MLTMKVQRLYLQKKQKQTKKKTTILLWRNCPRMGNWFSVPIINSNCLTELNIYRMTPSLIPLSFCKEVIWICYFKYICSIRCNVLIEMVILRYICTLLWKDCIQSNYRSQCLYKIIFIFILNFLLEFLHFFRKRYLSQPTIYI